ncbi:2-isopropylmalate synthase [candidate division KSB1 bacterium]|nr:2-isopropylmalate synthase [candidate division KSB1 bacterium]
MNEKVMIMDTTLRDGEQMRNVSYSFEEKLSIARILLEELKVHRIEIASARVSEGERKSAKAVLDWAGKAGYFDQVEILGFTDYDKSVDWITETGGRVMNLLAKGDLMHVETQLRKSKEEHVADIEKTIQYAKDKNFICNIYLEAWSHGMIRSKDYVYYILDALKDLPITRYMIPDTLGILSPSQVADFSKDLLDRYGDIGFDFHAHDDYGVSVANTLAAVENGIRCVHTTINGMGERAGNTPLDEVVIGIHDFLKMDTGVDETLLYHASRTVELYSSCRVAFNKPICGPNVFTQTAGIHADGDMKGNLYASDLLPERFNRKRQYALGKMSGKSSLDYNLEKMGIDLTPEQKKTVLARVIELGDHKKAITEADLPYIISDMLETPQEKMFVVVSAIMVTSKGLKPVANVKIRYMENSSAEPRELEEIAGGDGGYDAFMNAIKAIAKKTHIKLPLLDDYAVSIPPGGKTDALVQCSITWVSENQRFITRGLNSDQVLAAVEATEKMLNLVALQQQSQGDI